MSLDRGLGVQLRDYEAADTESLAAVYRDAVQGTGRQAYPPAQLSAWSAWAGEDAFRSQLRQGETVVAEVDGRIAAFGQLHPSDRIALLYTASAFARQGWATRIYAALEARASAAGATRLHTDASRIARHFFLKMGFRVFATEVAVREGLPFERFRMEKRIG